MHLLAILLALAAPHAPEQDAPIALRLGLAAQDLPSSEHKLYAPLARAIERGLASAGAARATVEVVIHKGTNSLLTALERGEIDFAPLDAGSWLVAHQRRPTLAPLVVELEDGAPRTRCAFVVPATSSARSLRDLRDTSLAFGDLITAQGRWTPQAELLRAGLRASDLRYTYLARPDMVVRALEAGDWSAGVLPLRALALARTPLRELARFEQPSRVWALRASFDDELAAGLRAAMEQIDAETLRPLALSGFAAAPRALDEALVQDMALADEFQRPNASP